MRSLALGSVAAAVVMYALGFLFFGVFSGLAFDALDANAQSALQSALGGGLVHSGTYMIPADETAWMAGPSAVVNFVAAGDSPSVTQSMVAGFIHMLVTAFLIGLAVKAIGGDFARKSRAVLWFGIAASLFMHLGDPVWMGFSWKYGLWVATFDAVMFIAAGLVLARWFTGTATAAMPTGAAAPAE
ncbi:hypothetical protein ACFSCW_05420 [Sphingomonas tabacisoli]|uniref:DUF1761 domain-containing protein n=1 Tax=Sphingomonas tabacisoli TaxID=2249466 RepID=A0ABW4I296_9SPHN